MTLKERIRAWLEIEEIEDFKVKVSNDLSFEANAIKNRIWYRGDANELDHLYQTLRHDRKTDKFKFWAAESTSGLEIQKRSTGIAGLMVDTLTDIVLSDFNGFELSGQTDVWNKIAKDNSFDEMLTEALKETLYIGDGAWKISLDPEISDYPIIEFWSGEKIDVGLKRGRLRTITFKSIHRYDNRKYELHEEYGYGYIKYHLYYNNNEVPLDTVPYLADLQEITFDDSYIMAVLMRHGRSDRWQGRGQSIYERKIDSLDALDEVWSQWMDALRAGRTKEYIPDVLIPRNEKNGALLKPNAFDNRFIATGSDMSENAQNKITTEAPVIQHESYLASYITALDLCLQGIISPSTLGIDTKKLDNAEAQREKEKTTLYTRQTIINLLNDALPKLVKAVLNTQAGLTDSAAEKIEVKLKFGEYANPSFESQIETISKAKTSGIMSVENAVEELYGDSKDEAWKQTEVSRLKAEQGIIELEEPVIKEDVINEYNSTNRETEL